jgi:urease accessory protein
VNGGLKVLVEGTRVVMLAAQPPVAAKVIARPEGPELVLIGSAAGLLEGDSVSIELTLGAGARLAVRSTAATLAHPCLGGGSTAAGVTARLGPGARLAWLPEPLVACAGCRHRSRAMVELEHGATCVWQEACTLGRSGEEAGSVDLRLDVTLCGAPLFRDGLAYPAGATSPAVLGGLRHLGTIALLGRRLPGSGVPGAATGLMELAGPGAVARAVAPDAATLERRLAPARSQLLAALNTPFVPQAQEALV